MIDLKLDKKIKSLQSDWGREYQKLSSYLISVSIIHRTTYSHTHGQNDLAERKHRQIIDQALATLVHGICLQPIGMKYVFMFVFTIKRLPSSMLTFQSPLQVLFGPMPYL